MGIADYFRAKAEPVPPEPTVEEARALRRTELLADLARSNAESEALSAHIANFLFEHKISGGGYKAASLRALGELPARELALRQRETVLNQQRSAILHELAALTDNPNEAVHVAGKAVHHAA